MKKKMICVISLMMAILAVYALTGCSSGSSLENIQKEDNKVKCTYEEVKHEFKVYLPEVSKNAPLVLILHGAGGSAESFRDMIEFEKDALPMGYGVCYVTGSVNVKCGRNGCSWNYGRISGDYDDVGFIKAVVDYLVDEYSFDEDRVYCAGFSNGGFMNHRLALEAQDTFKACVSVAGALCGPEWKNRPEKNNVGFLQVTGEKDEAVPKNLDETAKYSIDPAIEDVIDYYVSSNSLEKQSEEEIGKGSLLTKYGKDGDPDSVWTLLVKGGKHGWPDESGDGINTNKLILEFYESRNK